MKTEAITLIKEDVLTLGQMVKSSVAEMTCLLKKDPRAQLTLIEEQEEVINQACYDIEEKCLDLLMERDFCGAHEIRTALGSTVIAAKLERLADHANRVARIASWASQDKIDIPFELSEMSSVVHRMLEDVLLCFLTDAYDKVHGILNLDNQIDYLHDLLSKKLLTGLGEQDQQEAQMCAQFLFAARFLERMGDACCSIAKRVYFIVTGKRLKLEG